MAEHARFAGVLESPLTAGPACVGERLPVRGWALCEVRISHIEAWCITGRRTRLRHALPRPDVAVTYGEFANADSAGFAGEVSIEGLAPGKHTLEVAVYADGVQVHRWQRSVQIADPVEAYGAWRARLLAAARTATEAETARGATGPLTAGPFATWIVVTDERTTPNLLSRTFTSLREAGDGFASLTCPSGATVPLPQTPFVGQLRAGDVVAAGAAELVAAVVSQEPEIDLLYTDHDHLRLDGRHADPVLKPAWSDLLAEHPEVGGRPWLLRRSRLHASTWTAGAPLANQPHAAFRGVAHLPLPLIAVAGDAWPVAVTTPADQALNKISVIVPTCLADPPMLARCLDGLRSRTDHADRIELVVVLNNVVGMDLAQATAFLSAWSPTLVHGEGSFNWSALNNLGVRASSGEWLLFLNDDVEPIDPGWMDAMLALAQRPGIGAVGAVLRYPDGSVQHAGVTIDRRDALACRHAFRGCSGNEPRIARWLSHDRVQSAVTGACLLTSRRLFVAQGGFDERLPVVFNDVDYCLRLRRSGQASAVAAAAVLTHYEGRSRAGIEESADHAFFLARWAAELPAIDAFGHPALAHDRDDWLPDLLALPEFKPRISMNMDPRSDLYDTDLQWQRWGEQEPYYGVITQEMFRRDKLNDEALQLFFNSGRNHAKHVLELCKRYFHHDFVPRRVLDFGCGVGRLLIGFSEWAEQVVGVDISEAMLAEARKNCDAHGLKNIVLVRSDDQLSQVDGEFDLVHSTIVLQHINPQRGRDIFARLVERVGPGGVGSVHLTYAKAYLPDSLGQPTTAVAAVVPEPPPVVAAASAATDEAANSRKRWRLPFFQAPAQIATPAPAAQSPVAEPAPTEVSEAGAGLEMQMNVYPLNEIFYLVQTAGIREMHVEFSDHGGELGVVLFFRRPPT